MSRFWYRAAGSCLVLVLAPPAAIAQYDVQTLTAEDLVQAGVTRLGDIFALADGWTASSTAGYSWDASLAGSAPFDVPTWKLFLDGSPVDLRVLGGQDINTLPVSVSEICIVEFYTQPTILSGIFAASGAIDIHSCRPAPGISASVLAGAGSETGDPGPFKYTELGGPNVDRSGPILQGALAASNSSWHLRLQGRVDEHHATDERIRMRVHTLYDGEKDARIFHTSARAELGRWGRRARHRLTAGAARFEDLTYYEPLALEVPANHEYLRAGATGSYLFQNAAELRYRLNVEHSELATRPNPADVNLDWRQETLRLYTAVRRTSGRWRSEFGLGGRQMRVGHLDVPPRFVAASHGDVTLNIRPRAAARGMARIERGGPELAYAVSAELRLPAGAFQTIRLAVTLAQQVAAFERPLSYWITQGYDAARFDSAHISQPPVLRSASLDASWEFRYTDQVRLALAGAIRRYRNLATAVYDARYNALTTGLDVSPGIREAWGHLARLAAELDFRPHESIALEAYGAYIYSWSQDALFLHASRRHPTYLAAITARFRPNARFSLFARLRYRGATDWPTYRHAAREAPAFYASALPIATILDLTVQKRFWRHHMRMGASLRNLLDRTYLTHPAGGRARLAVHFFAHFFVGRDRSGR